jgi:hypothetical protein
VRFLPGGWTARLGAVGRAAVLSGGTARSVTNGVRSSLPGAMGLVRPGRAHSGRLMSPRPPAGLNQCVGDAVWFVAAAELQHAPERSPREFVRQWP